MDKRKTAATARKVEKLLGVLSNKKRILIVMRRPITYAELFLIIILLPVGIVGTQHLHEFVTDRISIEVKFK